MQRALGLAVASLALTALATNAAAQSAAPKRGGVLEFHDGTPLSSADVKASYERIAHPPKGVVSARQLSYASIDAIDTPDARTIVFHLKWPEAAMLANFASSDLSPSNYAGSTIASSTGSTWARR